jgi:hypothetical protein
MKDNKPHGGKKFGRLHTVRERYDLPDPTTYRLIHLGLIKSVVIQRPGTTRGTRLIDLESVDAYLSKLAEEQP